MRLSYATHKDIIKNIDYEYNGKYNCLKYIEICFGLVCLMLNVQVNNFSVMLGRSHRFLGITSTFGG